MNSAPTPTPQGTPRCDKEAVLCNYGMVRVGIDFARTLERELSTAQARASAAETALARAEQSRRDEESWWREKHDYQSRAEKSEETAVRLKEIIRAAYLHQLGKLTTDDQRQLGRDLATYGCAAARPDASPSP